MAGNTRNPKKINVWFYDEFWLLKKWSFLFPLLDHTIVTGLHSNNVQHSEYVVNEGSKNSVLTFP